jgi:hypothetical protein
MKRLYKILNRFKIRSKIMRNRLIGKMTTEEINVYLKEINDLILLKYNELTDKDISNLTDIYCAKILIQIDGNISFNLSGYWFESYKIMDFLSFLLTKEEDFETIKQIITNKYNDLIVKRLNNA